MTGTISTDPAVLAELVADAVTAHPSVARLDGGTFGTVATFLPTRKLVGVHVGRPGEPVEIAVVLRLDRPIPDTVASLRTSVRALCDGSPVDVTVSDIELPGDPDPDDADTPPGKAGVRRPVGVTPGTSVEIGP
ncbi:hypothetical protein [Pseudonocardia endophytica]|uniref:Alkaline shock family protein YloU n=1 Tax=Pseudonocardia endophytica TaxID=401976 RepID=A0A4R1HRW0_PSEEN|nr:hypothetical protein [Pseudonocardia endophytica]TCK24908.1 hypothetical protein EV378_0703 [Pseudonocardia endophytica]